VAAQVGVGEVGGDGRGDPLRGEAGRGVEGDGVVTRRRPVGQVEPGGREHLLGLGHRVGGQPGQVALAPLEAVGPQSRREQREDEDRRQPVTGRPPA
jgi:hypothetical protein